MFNESFTTVPLTDIAPSYLYVQYKWSKDLQAFVDSYNSITQHYLDWFNNTPLSVYTNSSISRLLLDWIGKGIYGYARPAFIYPQVQGLVRGPYGLDIFGELAYADIKFIDSQSGNAVFVNDDIYKRALTWHVYKGDGYQMSIPWLKNRIARFIYGANGGDITQDDVLNISIEFSDTYGYIGEYGSMAPFGTIPYATLTTGFISNYTLIITVPDIPKSHAFKLLFDNGFLAKPFQINFKVIIS